MAPVIDTCDDDHARQLATHLLDAAGEGEDAPEVRTVTGTNGRVAFLVDDDLAGTAPPPADKPAKATKKTAPAKPPK